MRYAVTAVFAVLLLGLGPLWAQQATTTAGKVAAPAVTTPALSELESLKLNLSVSRELSFKQQMALLQIQLGRLQADREALCVTIEKAHPGWVLNRTSFAFTVAAPVK